ncbi:MAG: starch synthase [Polaribacter sp.]|jgi:starch synthase
MDKKKVLIITQEMQPYTALSEIAEIARQLPQYVQEKGMEIRVLMPRYGTINERRHRLHEVVRLSGMNIIVDEDDYPLIIKVASLPGARIQVYFLDNDDFFKRKSVFEDDKGEAFEDNEDRMVFFCKGVIETVKKFGWPPDIIHCHGWMTSLVPFYLKTAYKTEPLFQQSKVVYSIYGEEVGKDFTEEFLTKASINNLEPEDLAAYQQDKVTTLHEGAVQFSDAIIQGSEKISAPVTDILAGLDVPKLDYISEDIMPAYLEFFNSLMEQEEEVE